MIIETLEDWNARLACCCGMPAASAISTVATRQQLIRLEAVGHKYNSGTGLFDPTIAYTSPDWRLAKERVTHTIWTAKPNTETATTKTEFSGSGLNVQRRIYPDYTDSYHRITASCGSTPVPSTGTFHSGGGAGESRFYSRPDVGDPWQHNSTTKEKWVHTGFPLNPDGDRYELTVTSINHNTGVETVSVSNISSAYNAAFAIRTVDDNIAVGLITAAEWGAQADGILNGWAFPADPACYTTGTQALNNELSKKVESTSPDFRSTYFNIAFRIPNSFPGTYFKITFDVLEFPSVGDPFLVLTDQTVEWTGPGAGIASDPSWLTEWIEVRPPEQVAIRKIVNVRFIAWQTSRYGDAKPQVTGEAFPPPAP